MKTYIRTEENVLERYNEKTGMKLKLIFNTDPNAPSDEEIEKNVTDLLIKIYINSLERGQNTLTH